ncbi:retropepsin-like aspartic protease [Sphaerisporangium aureirubrum]|uniref:Retropepsin-like aspartic protease n=1 Tax=Sphaerisporangium aureirubrum TaxID=1544736 RepID=A0ABW1NRW3_9ACTN
MSPALRDRLDPHARAAWHAWARGDIDEAAHLAAEAAPRTRAHLSFLTSYVRGEYERALAHYGTALQRSGPDQAPALPRALDEAAAHALLHLDRPAEAYEHVLRRRGRRAIPPDLRNRVDHPLKVSLAATTVLPLAEHPLAPYLPAVTVTLDGRELLAHIDTGGTFLVMGTERAHALGIQLTPAGREHHGTTRTDLYTGTAGTLTLGDATLANVPVEAMPTLRGSQDVIVIGTNILQRFLTTIDSPGGRLILSPRRAAGHQALLAAREPVARVPFHLWADHYMIARGGFGTRHDLNFFIDSGLVYVIADDDGSSPRQACLYTTAKHYRSWSVPRATAALPHFHPGVPVHLGPLTLDDPFVATTPTRRPPWHDFGGIRIDGLLSHAFLSRHAWTLDFDRHEYTFR